MRIYIFLYIYETHSYHLAQQILKINDYIKKIYFPKLTSILNSDGADATYVFTNCYQLTEIHFGAANQAAIEASPGYSTAWGRGAGNVTIYFDL